jgi:hypothetical protein
MFAFIVRGAKYMVMPRDQNAEQNINMQIGNKYPERVEEFKYLGTTLTNKNLIRVEIRIRLRSGSHSVQNVLSSSLLSKNVNIKTYRTIILLVVLYGCETWSLTLREVFENRVQRRIFGPRRDEVTGEWRRLHDKQHYALCSSPNIIIVTKSRILRWAEHVARMGERRVAHSVLVGQP